MRPISILSKIILIEVNTAETLDNAKQLCECVLAGYEEPQHGRYQSLFSPQLDEKLY